MDDGEMIGLGIFALDKLGEIVAAVVNCPDHVITAIDALIRAGERAALTPLARDAVEANRRSLAAFIAYRDTLLALQPVAEAISRDLEAGGYTHGG